MSFFGGRDDDSPPAEQIGDEAWEKIVHAANEAPDGVPAPFVNSWGRKKRAREYLNNKMD